MRARRAWLCAIAALFVAAPAHAQQPNIDFTVSGTSTIRGWTCTAKGVLAVTPGPGGGAAVPGFAQGVKAATVTVPVRNFTCPNAEMTEHLMQAMKAEKHSEIVYAVDKYEVTGGQVQSTGTMTITGVRQGFNFPLTVRSGAGGAVEVEGNARLDMTAYGVDPPVVMGGLLKVGPQIRIQFKGLVTP